MGGRRKLASTVLLCLLMLAILLSACTLKPGRQRTQIRYRLPTALTVPVGKALPGTDIVYERMGDRGAYVIIKGQSALKRKGDSLDWKGEPIAGVSTDLDLRVAWYTQDELHLVGFAKVLVEGLAPQESIISASSSIKYAGPVVYSVGKGAQIPGTVITYEGRTDEGARLSGIGDYPYRRGGDSIFWEGTLRNGVQLRLDLRVVQFDDQALRVGGVATLWIEG
jgi:hypothetical protein